MTNYEKMLAKATKAYAARKTALVKSGKTAEEATIALRAQRERGFNATAARAKCGITSKPCTIGEILAAKMRG